MFMLSVSQKLELYQTTEAFVGGVARKVSPNVKLENIESLFFYFGGFMATILFVLIMNLALFMFIINLFLFNQQQIIKLLRYFTILSRFGESFSQRMAIRLEPTNVEQDSI